MTKPPQNGTGYYMADILFQNRYRIPSIRLPRWNYAGHGTYFVTICTNNRTPWFGHVENGHMELSSIGEIANKHIKRLPAIRKNVRLDEFIVMPDHIHMILTVEPGDSRTDSAGLGGSDESTVETPSEGVSTPSTRSNPSTPPVASPNKPKHWVPGALGAIINQFKRSCLVEIRQTDEYFRWQPRYHEHIIRNGCDLDRIRGYIRDNPRKFTVRSAPPLSGRSCPAR